MIMINSLLSQKFVSNWSERILAVVLMELITEYEFNYAPPNTV